MPKFIVALQSYETGKLVEVVYEAADEQAATDASDIDYPIDAYAWCYTTTPEQQYWDPLC